jgi:hypothetical protein
MLKSYGSWTRDDYGNEKNGGEKKTPVLPAMPPRREYRENQGSKKIPS